MCLHVKTKESRETKERVVMQLVDLYIETEQ